MRDKAIGEISEILFPLADAVYFTRPPIERAATPEEILAVTRYRPLHTVVEPDPVRALAAARETSSPGDVVLACGSLFLVGALLRSVKREP
jgi:dihydrofolate synthase / folylpolyglutamate synthase